MICLADKEGLKTFPQISCIYSIFSELEPKHYIGRTQNMRTRVMLHRSQLESERHNNYRLQSYYDQKGHTLWATVLEECAIERLRIRERHYFYVYDSILKGFNNPPEFGYNMGYRFGGVIPGL